MKLRDIVKESLYGEPDYKKLLELLDLAFEYAKDNLFIGKNFKIYYDKGYIFFDNVDGAGVGYTGQEIRKKNIFPNKTNVIITFKQAHFNREETTKQIEKLSRGRIKVLPMSGRFGVTYKKIK